MLTGSKEEISEDLDIDNFLSLKDLNQIIENFLDIDLDEEKLKSMSEPSHILSFQNNFEYFFCINKKSYVPLKNGTFAVPVNSEEFSEEAFKDYYVVNTDVFEIPQAKIVCIGWN
jgi:hypothetical protein